MNVIEHLELKSTQCAICGVSGNDKEVYGSRFSSADLNPAIFSARRVPDRIHYRMVQCRTCGLLRSDPIADADVLTSLYRSSTFDYAAETTNLKRTYRRYLRKVLSAGASRGSFLEIGCGNGFFLEEARTCGFREVFGIEPSASAVERAAAPIRDRIICDVMRPGLFPAASLDAIALFQVFDHLPDPAAVLLECRRILRPGGFILILNHDCASLSARMLGERSPIIDIEHTFLYSPETLTKLIERNGFQRVSSGPVWNRYTLEYLFRLLPFSAGTKNRLISLLSRLHLNRISVSIPLGNLYLIARNQPRV